MNPEKKKRTTVFGLFRFLMLLVKMKSLGVLNDVKAKGRFSSSEYTISFLAFQITFWIACSEICEQQSSLISLQRIRIRLFAFRAGKIRP